MDPAGEVGLVNPYALIVTQILVTNVKMPNFAVINVEKTNFSEMKDKIPKSTQHHQPMSGAVKRNYLIVTTGYQKFITIPHQMNGRLF